MKHGFEWGYARRPRTADMLPSAIALARAERRLVARLGQLDARLEGGDAAVWREYRHTAVAIAALATQTAAGRHGELLTTEQMAQRLNVSSKTLLRRKAQGDIRPALQRGRLIRWRGDEATR